MTFHHWFIPLSVIITLGTVARQTGELMFIAYISLFGLFYLIGNAEFFKTQKIRNNGYLVQGTLGTLILLLILSFGWFWEELRAETFKFGEVITSPEFIVAFLLTLAAGAVFYLQQKDKPIRDFKPLATVFLFFIPIFLIGHASPLAVVLVNLLIFAVGIFTILEGARKDHLGILNYGLLIIAILVTCRFFDTDLSFVLRGVLFLLVGIGFFATNYWMLKKRNANEIP